jgi:regulatory protein
VYVDAVSRLELRRETLRKHQLRPGAEVDAQALEAIVAADARAGALAAALALIARRPRSERDLRRRLRQRRCEDDVIDETVTKLRAARLIDDAEFAAAWAESRDRSSPRGQRLIAQELRQQGIGYELASEAANVVDDQEAAYRVAERRLASLATLEYDAFRSRLASQLQRRGFGWGVIRTTVERCWRESQTV